MSPGPVAVIVAGMHHYHRDMIIAATVLVLFGTAILVLLAMDR